MRNAVILSGAKHDQTPHRVPFLAVGSLLWQRYEAVRAFEPILLAGEEEVQHQARIAGKHLRYTIECFAFGGGCHGAGDAEPLLLPARQGGARSVRSMLRR